MSFPRVGPVEAGLLVLVAVTALARIHDALPASAAEISAVGAIARTNDDATRSFGEALAEDPEISKGKLRHLRERVVSIEAEAARLAANPTARAMADETMRLAAIPFPDMSLDDKLRWLLISVGRHSTPILGTLLGLCGMLVFRVGGRLIRSRL
jgi:hypothetical protein